MDELAIPFLDGLPLDVQEIIAGLARQDAQTLFREIVRQTISNGSHAPRNESQQGSLTEYENFTQSLNVISPLRAGMSEATAAEFRSSSRMLNILEENLDAVPPPAPVIVEVPFPVLVNIPPPPIGPLVNHPNFVGNNGIIFPEIAHPLFENGPLINLANVPNFVDVDQVVQQVADNVHQARFVPQEVVHAGLEFRTPNYTFNVGMLIMPEIGPKSFMFTISNRISYPKAKPFDWGCYAQCTVPINGNNKYNFESKLSYFENDGLYARGMVSGQIPSVSYRL